MFRNSHRFVTVLVGLGLGLCLSAPPAFGQAGQRQIVGVRQLAGQRFNLDDTRRLAEPGTGTVNISYTNQNANEFFRQTT